ESIWRQSLRGAGFRNLSLAYDAIKIMLSRGESGKNQHSLHGVLKGKSAADLPGSSKGRGGDRVLYSETENEIIIHDIVDYHKK
uniref:hypothetical protein n=1 Tax=Escherichia fergusonii TaxID=564 RepID=UPI0015D71C38